MSTLLRRLAGLAAVFALISCASGPKFDAVSATLPPLAAGKGRIYAYRTTALGAAIQPSVQVDGTAIGRAKASGFVFTDVAPGTHEVLVKSEVSKSTPVQVQSGKTSYVRLRVTMGVLAARIIPENVAPEVGAEEIKKCSLVKP